MLLLIFVDVARVMLYRPWETFAFGLAQCVEGVLKNLLQFGQFCKLPKWVHRNNHENTQKTGEICTLLRELL